MMKAGFLDSGGGGEKKKNNVSGDACFDQASKVTEGLNASSTNFTVGMSSLTDKEPEVTVVSNTIGGSSIRSGTPIATTTSGNYGNPNELNTRSIPYTNVVNGNEHVMNDTPSSYANKVIPTSLTKANLRKLEANVSNDVDYNVWLPLALVYEVPSRFSTCLIYGHSLNDCLKAAPKRVVKGMAKGKGQTLGVDEEGFIEGVGYGPKSLWEQWKDTTVEDEYNSYDDDMYEGQKIPEKIQTICDNFYIKLLVSAHDDTSLELQLRSE
ncbi:hypothetical protein Tco_0024939 [Tanacetum coccineum]